MTQASEADASTSAFQFRVALTELRWSPERAAAEIGLGGSAAVRAWCDGSELVPRRALLIAKAAINLREFEWRRDN